MGQTLADAPGRGVLAIRQPGESQADPGSGLPLRDEPSAQHKVSDIQWSLDEATLPHAGQAAWRCWAPLPLL